MIAPPPFPRFRAVADHAVLAEFGETIDPAIHAQVIRLDRLLAAAPAPGFLEAIPAYASLLVTFDPLLTDHLLVEAALRGLLEGPAPPQASTTQRQVQVCYDAEFSLDLPQVASLTGLTPDAVIAAHLAGDYRVYLYGFAPGYAYMAGVPEPIRLARKPSAVRDIPAGSVIIAGAQCLVTTLRMPTGWWIIGRSPTRILRDDPARPFLFDIGDTVRFQRISRAEFDLAERQA